MRERDEGRRTPKGKPTGQAMDDGRRTPRGKPTGQAMDDGRGTNASIVLAKRSSVVYRKSEG